MMDTDSQLVNELLPGMGGIGGVPQHHNYKRAVIKQPPKYFAVECLTARKMGNGYCYGMRIHPTSAAGITLSDAISTRSDSTSSSSSAKSHRTSTTSSAFSGPYEVWRRWEDCLWFQDVLEMEYKVMARTKRVRLQQGKGVKKDGMYIQSDQAASFESLPPGPDANTIAKDVHEIIPKLTKRGTLFRAGKETIEQRDREFKAMVEKLWDDEVPMLLKELRESRVIRDFFGYWRRDKDHDRKMASLSAEDKGKNRASRASVASSAFSMYFSASNISLQLPNAFSEYPPSPSVASTFGPRTPPLEKPARPTIRKAESYSSPSSSSASLPTPIISKSTKTRISVPHSISSNWSTGPRSSAAPTSQISFTVTEHGALVPTSPVSPIDDPLNSAILFVPEAEAKCKTVGGLQVLPEEQEQELAEGVADMSLEPSQAAGPIVPLPLRSAPPSATHHDLPPPMRRPRNISCPDPGVRNGLIFPPNHRPQSGVSEASVLNSPASTAFSDEWEDARSELASDDGATDAEPESELEPSLARRASGRSTRSMPRGSPPRPFTMYSTFSSLSQQDQWFDELVLDAEVPEEDEPAAARHMHHSRASVATMNSIMSNSSVDAVLPRRGVSASSRPLSAHRPVSPAPSFAPSVRSLARSASPTPSSSPTLSILGSPDTLRRMSTGSRKVRRSMTLPEHETEEGKWYEGNELPDEDLIDSYFYDPGLRALQPGYETPRRERVSQFVTQMATPEHFPKPFQNRPPGQFHLPWSPTDSSRTSQASIGPVLTTPTSASSVAGEHFTIKAVRQDSIVLLRATFTMSLADMRERLRDKFASQEGVQLTSAFTIGFNPAPADARQSVKPTGRARSNSTSALTALNGQPRLKFIANDADWEQAIAGCSGKLTLHVFDRF